VDDDNGGVVGSPVTVGQPDELDGRLIRVGERRQDATT